MRFEDWDVLLFPRDSKIPMKEFKTNCHVVHDTGKLQFLPKSLLVLQALVFDIKSRFPLPYPDRYRPRKLTPASRVRVQPRVFRFADYDLLHAGDASQYPVQYLASLLENARR